MPAGDPGGHMADSGGFGGEYAGAGGAARNASGGAAGSDWAAMGGDTVGHSAPTGTPSRNSAGTNSPSMQQLLQQYYKPPLPQPKPAVGWPTGVNFMNPQYNFGLYGNGYSWDYNGPDSMGWGADYGPGMGGGWGPPSWEGNQGTNGPDTGDNFDPGGVGHYPDGYNPADHMPNGTNANIQGGLAGVSGNHGLGANRMMAPAQGQSLSPMARQAALSTVMRMFGAQGQARPPMGRPGMPAPRPMGPPAQRPNTQFQLNPASFAATSQPRAGVQY